MRDLSLLAMIASTSSFARADAVYLQGGQVLEGTATVEGDKVTVALESGSMSFARSEVERIEKSTPPLEVVEQREKALASDDIAGMLELASYCRDHNLLGRERALLEHVIAREPNHPGARGRLGFVRVGGRWVLRSEELRKERAEQAARRDEELVRKRQQLELEEATLRRDRAQAELRAELARERAPQPTQPAPGWYSPVVVAPAGRYWNHGYPQRAPLAPQPWAIPGTSDPHAPSGGFINGARSPQSYFDEAYRNAYGHPPAR